MNKIISLSERNATEAIYKLLLNKELVLHLQRTNTVIMSRLKNPMNEIKYKINRC